MAPSFLSSAQVVLFWLPGRWEINMRTLFTFFVILAGIVLPASVLAADLEPELGSVETMAPIGDHTFIVTGFMGGGNIFAQLWMGHRKCHHLCHGRMIHQHIVHFPG